MRTGEVRSEILASNERRTRAKQRSVAELLEQWTSL